MIAHPVFSLYFLGDIINYFTQIIGVLYIINKLNSVFIIILMVLSILLIILTNYTQKRDYDFKFDNIETERKLKCLYDIMTKYKYAKEIRINNADKYIKDKYVITYAKHVEKIRHLIKLKFGTNTLSVFFSCIQLLIIYVYFTYQCFIGNINIGDYVVMLSATTLFMDSFLALFNSFGKFNNALNSIEIYHEYETTLKNNKSISDSNKLQNEKNNFTKSSIRFKNVFFRYPNSSDYILKNLNIEIQCGKKLGLVGLNGAGKTTLIKLLLRLYEPTEGQILLGEVNINQIPYNQYIKHFSVVLQDFFLFSYSIKENIIFDGVYTSKKLFDCIEKSGLLKKISNLENGIDTSVYKELDDAGVEFSGGEAQRLALCRALYNNSNIFILDEPSSFQDPMAEHEFLSKFNELTNNKTTIFISHRLSSMKLCDDIVVIDSGSIVEHGSHNDLLKNNGYYSDIYHSQQKYYDCKEYD